LNPTEIHVTKPDFQRLEHLVNGWWATDDRTRELLELLQQELDRALIVESEEVDPDRITLGSEVALRDLHTGEVTVYRLAWPRDAASGDSLPLSILSPMGISALGYREGDQFEVAAPGGKRRLRVEEVRYQPERRLRAAQPA